MYNTQKNLKANFPENIILNFPVQINVSGKL